MTSTDILVDQVADNCFRLSLADSSWQAIGFGCRPRRGLLWSLFTPAWKEALEKKIHRELILVFSAAHLSGLDEQDALLRKLVGFYWGDDGRFGPAFSFSSEAECVDAINQYLNADDWVDLLWKHLGVMTVPDRKLRARLLVRSAEFTTDVRMIGAWVRQCGVGMENWPRAKTPGDVTSDLPGNGQ